MNPTRFLTALRSFGCLALLLGALVTAWPAQAAPVSAEQAQLAAERWLAACPAPLGARLLKTKAAGEAVGKVEALTPTKGAVVGYVVSLKPEGYLIVSGDTRIEPIIAFSQDGAYDPKPENPLVALLAQDLPARLNALAAKTPASPELPAATAKNEAAWASLISPAKPSGTSVVVEEWVPFFLKSRWSQGTEGGRACYNYYTPQIGDSSYTFDPGNPTNMVSGCAATATAQMIRYFAWPEAGIGYKTGGCSITFWDATAIPDGTGYSGQLRGGNGNGGPYDWAAMTLDPDGSESEHSLQQIGALCWDAGISIGMSYNIERSGMSGANFSASAFTSNFNYAGAASAGGPNGTRANLDARRPVAITIGLTNPLLPPPGGGHAIVGDGYGRIDGRWYYHFNMGWGGGADLWYNVEEYYYAGPGGAEWAGFGTSVGNVYRTSMQPKEDAATGKIMSGRITDAAGNPVPGVQVKIQQGGIDFLKMMVWNEPTRDFTDANGIWAIDKVPTSATPYTIVLTKPGLSFSGPFEQTVGASNLWGLNFTATGGTALTLVDWWYDVGNVIPSTAVVVLQFNRPIGAVTVDPTKLTVKGYTLTAANTAIFQAADSPYVIIQLNATDAAALAALTPPLTLDLTRAFLVADVDGQGTQAGELDAATVPVAPLITARAENAGLPTNPAAPQVAEVRLLEGTTLIGSAESPHPTNASQIDFMVRFSSAVSGVDPSDFRLRVTNSFFDVFTSTTSAAKADTAIPSAVITGVNPVTAGYAATTAPTAYWLVTVDVGQGDGYIRLDVIDDDSITNGTALGGAAAHNGDYQRSPYAYHVDNLGPVIVAATLATDDTYVDITWSEPVGGTNSLSKTSDFDDLTPVYYWRDTNVSGGQNATDALWLDRGSVADNTYRRRDDVVMMQPPFTAGLQDGQARTGQFKNLTVSGVPLPPSTRTIAQVCYIDTDGVLGCSTGDGLFLDIGVQVGLSITFDQTYTSGQDYWFWPTGSEPGVATLGALVPDRMSYYAANGAIPSPAYDGDPMAAYEAWILAFFAGTNNGIWLDYGVPDGKYNVGDVATGFVDSLVMGIAPANNATGTAMPANAMYRDTNSDGKVNSTDLIWIDNGSPAFANALDGSDNRLDTNGAPLPGALFQNALQVIFKQNGGTLTSVGISSITDTLGAPLTQGATVTRCRLKYTPALDLSGGAKPAFLNEYRVPTGVETIEIVPVANSVFDGLGNVADTQTTTGEMKLYDKSIPRIVDVVLADDNYSARVTFSERVYTNASGIGNHGPKAVSDRVGNLKAADFVVTVRNSTGSSVLYTVPLTDNDVSQNLGTYVCNLNFNNYRASIDPGLVAPELNRYSIVVQVVAAQVYDFHGNAVPATSTTLLMRPACRAYPTSLDISPTCAWIDIDTDLGTPAVIDGAGVYNEGVDILASPVDGLPPTYFTSQARYRRAADSTSPYTTAPYQDNTSAPPGPAAGTGLDHYGIYYRDLDGDCRVDAVDLNFRNPNAPRGNYPTYSLNGVAAGLFRVWVQNNDPEDTSDAPDTEGLYSASMTPPNIYAWPFTGNWTQVSVTGASVIANSTYYSTVRVTINQAQVRARTHGKRWVLIDYTDPTPGSNGLAPYLDNDPAVPQAAANTDDREKDQIHWYWDNPDAKQSDSIYIVDAFGPIMAWDGAPARPISATMWRVTNYTKPGEPNFNSYDYMDVVFSEPVSSVSNYNWSPAPSSGEGSSVDEKDGPYGPEIIDLLSGERQTVRLWFDNNNVTSRAISGTGGVLDNSPMANVARGFSTGPTNGATPNFNGMALAVRPLDSRYRVLGFSADNTWVDMIQMDSEGAHIQQGNWDTSALSFDHLLYANSITLRGYDQGGFSPNSDAYWRRSDGSVFLLAGNTTNNLGNIQAARTFSAAANNSAVTPGDAFVSGANQMVVYNANLAGNSVLPSLYTMKAPAAVASGPVYAMAKVSPITTGGTSRLDEQDRRVLGIDTAGLSSDVIDAITVRVVDTTYGQFDPEVDLLPLADDATSGVRLYKTFGTTGLVQLAAGGMEWSDWKINDEGHPYREVVLRPLVSQTVPHDDDPANGNDSFEYEIRVVTSVAFTLGDSFYVEIPDNGILFRRARSSDDFASGWDTKDGTPGLVLTDHLYLDANGDQRWGMAETILDIEDAFAPAPFYDAGVPYAHRSQNTPLLSVIRTYQRNMYYAKRGASPNPNTDPEPPGATGEYPSVPGGIDTDYNVAYSPGDDVWYDIGGKLGVYDAGVDIPVVGNSDQFQCAWSPHEEGARSVQVRGAVPATVSAIAGAATVSAGSQPTAVLGIDMHDSGRTFAPRYAFGIAYGFVVEAVSKSLPGGTYTGAIAYVAAAQTLTWRGGPPVNVAAAGRYLLADSTNTTFIVISAWGPMPGANTTASLTVSADVDRDIQQPAAIRGVRVHAVGPGNVPGKTGALRLTGSTLSWQSDSSAGGTLGTGVDVSAGGIFVLSAERATSDYLIVQVGLVNGPGSENLAIYPADGRNITPFQTITGLEIVAVSSVVDQGTYRFTYDGSSSLTWAEGGPTNVSGTAGTQTIVPGNADGTAFVVVRRTAELLPDAASEDYLFLNQARLLRITLSVTDQGGFTSTHLAPLTAGPDSGIALFRDANANGVFDGPLVDEFVPLSQAPVFGGAGTYTLTLNPDPRDRAAHLPNSHVAPAVGNDYFIAVRTTYDISYGDRFSVSANVFEPTEPDAAETGNPSFAGGSTGVITCTSVTNTVYNDATVAPWTVDAGTAGVSRPIPLFGVDHFLGALGTVYLQSITFTLHSVNGFRPVDDLMAMDDPNQALRGAMLFARSGALINCDIVTEYDDATGTYKITLLPTATSAATQVPVSSDGGLSDHFVGLNLSPSIDYGDEFYATVEVGDIQYSTGVGNAASRLTTHSLIATIASRYNDLTTRVQTTPTAGLVINSIGSAVLDGYHQVAISFNPATGTYSLTWNGFTVPVGATQIGTYTLGSGTNSITVTFDPQAFFGEDVLIDGDGIATLRAGVPETALDTALRPLQDSSLAGGVVGRPYYVDVDLDGVFSSGDAIALAGNAGLVFNLGTDAVILGTPVAGALVAPPSGATLHAFAPADRLAYSDKNANGKYDDGEDIVRDTDGVYSLPGLDQVLDTDGNATLGIGPGSLITEDASLVGANTVSVLAGATVPGFGGLYYYDADGSGNFSHGDDIVVRPAVGGVIPGTLTFNSATDQIVFDGDDAWDGDETTLPEAESQVTNGAPLSRFVAADQVAFEQGGAVPLGYEAREDIFRSFDNVYNSPAFSWSFRVTNGDRKIRRYEPTVPTPFNDPRYAMSAVIGLDIANSGATDVTLDRLTVRLWNVNQFNATTDLRALENGAVDAGVDAGILLYRDADGNGVFDPFVDWLMPLAEVPAWTSNGNEYRVTFAPALYNTVDHESVDGVYDFFVVVQPDQDANNWQFTDSGDQFYAQINNGDLVLSKAVNVVSITSDILTIDSLPPQLTVQADINDADSDGYLDSASFTFHEDLQPGHEDAADWRLTDADGTTNLSPASDDRVTLSASYRTLTIALEDIAGTTGRITYQTLYDSDHFGLFDWAGNPVDFTAANLVTADDVAPVIVHSGIVVEPTWFAAAGAVGVHGKLLFHDRNHNGQWDTGEDIFEDVNGNNTYNQTVDRRLWDGGDAWVTVDSYSAWLSNAGLYFYDENGDGQLGARESAWIDRTGPGTSAGIYNTPADLKIVVRRGEEIETLDLDGNGRLDAVRVTFSEAVRDSTLSGFTNFWTNIPATGASTTWFLSGRTNVQVDPNGPGAGSLTEQNNNALYLTFDEAAASVYDTDQIPDLTTVGEMLQDMNGNRLNGGTNYGPAALVEDDQAQPVLLSARGNKAITGGNIPAGTVITLTFSEPMTAFTALDLQDFTTDPDGPGGWGASTPAFDGATGTLTIVSGYVVITLTAPTTSNRWTEDTTIAVTAGRPDNCVGDRVANNLREGTPAVQIRGLGSILVTEVRTLDTTGNGRIDAMRITFDRAVRDSTLTGYAGPATLINVANNGNHWQVAGRAGTVFIDPNGPTGYSDVIDNAVLYLVFSPEGLAPDTGTTPLLTISGTTLISFDNEPVDPTSVPATTDGAAPVMINVATFDLDLDGKVDATAIQFSEPVVDATVDPNDFTIGGRTAQLLLPTFVTPPPAWPNLVNDAVIVLQITTDANEVDGTNYKTVAYVNDNDSVDVADAATNKARSHGDGEGWVSRLDAAKPQVILARTRSDRSIALTFSELVTDLQPGDLTANGGLIGFGAVNAAANPVIVWSAAPATWNTDATGSAAGSGTDAAGISQSALPNLTIAAGAILDLASVPNAINAVTASSLTTDGAPPVVVKVHSTVPANNTYTLGQSVPALVDFSESVTVTGVPTLTLQVSATAQRLCSYEPAAVSRTLQFGYIVVADDNRRDPYYLDYPATTSLAFAGGNIVDLAPALNQALLTLPAPGSATALYGHHIQIDTIPPTVETVETVDDNTLKITFSEPIENSAGEIAAAIAAIGISDGGAPAATLPFDAVSTDPDNASLVSAADGDLVVIYLHMTDASKNWNTDATGTTAGVGTDAMGTHRTNVPTLIIAAGALLDTVTLPIADTAFDGTLDKAPPVVITAGYRDVTADGRVDQVRLVLSEPVNVASSTGWTLSPNDLAISATLGTLTHPTAATLTLAVSALAPETGVDHSIPETEPALDYDDLVAEAIADLSPAANALQPFGTAITLADQAGPAVIAASVAMPTAIDLDFSEKLEPAANTVIPADFAVAAYTVSNVGLLAAGASARLTLATPLTLTSAPAVSFSTVGAVADTDANPNQQTATLVASALSLRLQLTAPATDRVFAGGDAIDVNGKLDLAASDLTGWVLYFAEGHSPLEATSGWANLSNGSAPVVAVAKLGEFIPNVHADNPLTLNWSAVLRVTFADGVSLDVVRYLIVAGNLPTVGIVNDSLGADIDFQKSTLALSANWSGLAVPGVITHHYEVAYNTDPSGYPTTGWTAVALATNATLPGLALSDATAYYFKVRAVDAGGNVIALQTSDGVVVDTAAPTAGTVLDGAAAGIDITWQASDSAVAANWSRFADSSATAQPSSGIASYEWAIFTQVGAVPTPTTDPQKLAWTNVGNVAAAAANLGAGQLLHDQLYYAAVRALDLVGNQGQPGLSNGFRPDRQPPVPAAVRDGLGADIDITASLTTLSGNWDPFTDLHAGLSTYQYRIVTDVSLITAGWEKRTTPALGALHQGRTRFGMARLADGRTMAIGGWTGVAALATVEIYTPATGAWTLTGPLQHARYGAAVVALPDGDVIVAGGSNGSTYLSSVERYNHLTMSWSQIATLGTPRENAAAALMADGSVWVAGGRGAVDNTSPATTALSGYRDVVDRISLPANTVSVAGSLSQPRAGAAAYRLTDGRLVIFGGENVNGALSATDVYTPGPGWSTTSMPTARANFAHVQLPDGDLLAIGGTTSGTIRTAAVDRFDAATGTWSALAPMATARSHFGAAWVESTGTVLVAGGINSASTFLTSAAEYNPDNDVWTSSAALNRGRGYHTLISCSNGLVMAIGGLADWLITGETEVRRFAAPITAWTSTVATNGTVGSLTLQLGRTYYFQVRAFDSVGNRSDTATSDGVAVSSFGTPPVVVTLVGPSTAAVGETFNVQVYVREDNPDAQGFRGGPLDLNFTAARAQVTVDGGFSPSAVLSTAFTALGDTLTSGTLHNSIGLIDELGGATTANGLGEGAAPGVLYATIPFRATSAGALTIAAGPGLSGLVLTPPIGTVPADSTNFGAALNVTILQGVTLSVDGSPASVNEGGAFRIRATLSAPATEPVNVTLAFAGSATPSTDYTVSGLTGSDLVIGTGETSTFVTVQTANDGTAESNETIIATIASVSSVGGGYAEVDEQATSVNIVDSGRPGDANGDGLVDYYDLLELISEYGKINPGPADLDADFDNDGDVDYYDLLILIANFTTTKASSASAALANDAKVPGPSATISLVGPASVAPGATFNVDVYVQVSASAGFGGGPLDLDFTTAKVDYAEAFAPVTIIQAPFNGLLLSPAVLNEATGQVIELGGGTVATGYGYGAPVFYARLAFKATAAGTATFTASAGTVELRVVGGTIPFANTTYGSPLIVTIGAANLPPTADNVTAQTGVDQAIDLTLSGADPDGNPLTFNLPTLGQAAYPAHGDLSNSRPGPVSGTRLITYTPDLGYNGPDSFTYTVNDGTANSPAATVAVTIGGFLADLVITQTGGVAYTTLRLGMQPGASDSFALPDGDYLATPPLISGGGAYLLAPFGEQLAWDIRGISTEAQWQLAITVPGSVAGETWNIAWQPANLPSGALCFLTPADATWAPAGAAIDMTTISTKAVVNGTATPKTLRFLVTVAAKQTVTLALKPGWNLIGVPLTLDDDSLDALFGDARLIALYQYSTAAGYTVPAEVTPGRAYWAFANAAFSLELSGAPASGGVPLTYGWNLVAPYTDSPNPMDGTTVIAVWAWDPVVGYYIPALDGSASVHSTMGIWVFTAQDTVIWNEGR
jgi:hypothetical protein